MFKKTPFDQLAARLRAFADPNRLHIVALLLTGEHTAAQLNDELQICQPTLSHHMKVLCQTGLVDCRKVGVRCFYRMNAEKMQTLGQHILMLADYSDRALLAQSQNAPPPLPPRFDSCLLNH